MAGTESYTQGTDLWDQVNFADLSGGFDGGPGIDTVHFAAPRAAIDFHRTPTGAVIDSADGLALVNTERLVFSDGEVAIDIDGWGGMIYRLYALLDRTPQPEELSFWTHWMPGPAWSYTYSSLAATFLNSSDEARTAYGPFSATADADGLVRKLYESVLGREAAADERHYWVDRYGDGTGSTAVILGITESAEAVAKSADLIAGGIWLGPLTLYG